MNKDGGPAFPIDSCRDMDTGLIRVHDGMSLRDWFAGMAMQGYCSSDYWREETDLVGTACVAYQMADAMLAERNHK